MNSADELAEMLWSEMPEGAKALLDREAWIDGTRLTVQVSRERPAPPLRGKCCEHPGTGLPRRRVPRGPHRRCRRDAGRMPTLP
jgi:hypothetical protein